MQSVIIALHSPVHYSLAYHTTPCMNDVYTVEKNLELYATTAFPCLDDTPLKTVPLHVVV